ncbi:MAG: RNA polymerase sigma factor [Candidatus Hinthialibacter sp.]
MTDRNSHFNDRWFENIYQEYFRWAVNVAYRFLHDRDEAEDIAQEAFLRIYNARTRYQPMAKFKTYLFQIIRNLCIDFIRQQHPIEQGDASDLLVPDSANKISIDRIEIEQRLARLPKKVRNIFILYYLEDKSYKEIALLLNISEKSVGNILYKWRQIILD